MASERLPNAVNSILETPPGEDVVPPEVEPVRVRGGAEVAGAVDALERGPGERDRPRGRAGRAAPQHRRLVREPRPAQPEPAVPPARLDHAARAGGVRPRRARAAVPPRPPRHPHAPQRRVAAGARGRGTARVSGRHRCRSATSCGARSAKSRSTRGSGCSRSTTRRWSARPSPTSATSSPSWSRTRLTFSPPDST